jgi:hypothetical protein
MDSELKQYLEGMESRLDKRLGHLDSRVGQLDQRMDRFDERMGQFDNVLEHFEARLVEKMRHMQTELLRGFASFSEAQTLRLRKVEADQSNLDLALSGRVSVLEKRLLEIELRLGRA